MFKNMKKREIFVLVLFSIVSIVYVLRLYNITVIHGAEYTEQSLNNRITRIETFATRGEIRDRNNRLIAGNETSFNIKFLNKNMINLDVNALAIKIITILEENGEKHLEFPIRITDDGYEYISTIEKYNWLERNNFDKNATARDVLNTVRDEYLISDDLTDEEAYNMLSLQGVYLPIRPNTMEFTYVRNKEQFLDMYSIDYDTSAEEAFEIIRNKSYFDIAEEYNDDEAYKILALKHALAEKGYQKYDPVIIAENVSQKTASIITELNMDLPGISVEVKPIRNYPNDDVASHILGYMGHISSQYEINKYVKEENYNKNQLIGKTGIEGEYELKLTGENGYKYIEVNALGHYVKDVEDDYDSIENKKSVSGEDLQLSIDIELQEKLENHLRTAFKGITTGTAFESKWGDYPYTDQYEGAELGGAVVVDVNTGEVLALASVPTYDLNLFANGISNKDWNSLSPVNKNNPLAPRPLYNNATMTSVQPGSVYKMVTAYAALEAGLDPTQKLYADGYITVGGNNYGCWYWNSYHAKHGLTDLYKAIEVSCNYYFFNVANGYDYYRERDLGFEMDSDQLIDVSRKFGLNDSSGVEISEVVAGVPDPDKKKKLVKYYLREDLNVVLGNYFPEEITSNDSLKDETISTIVGWSEENPSRNTIIERLLELGLEGDYYRASELADIVKYDYFNLMRWYEGDTLNFSIGQGDHQYTPVQIVKYIASIANGGTVRDLTLIKDNIKEPSYELDPELVEHLRKGMYQAINGSSGTARRVFANFPITVAGKTGTAEKQGMEPPLDEIKYLKDNLSKIEPNLDIESVEKETTNILRERNDYLASLEKDKNKLILEDEDANAEEINRINEEIRELIRTGYLNKGYAMRAAIKNLSEMDLTNEMINQYRKKYSDYGWFVSFAPYDDPEIAVAVLIGQGGHGSYAAPVAREIIGDYFNLEPEESN
jgi:penicillin-binding protein 2